MNTLAPTISHAATPHPSLQPIPTPSNVSPPTRMPSESSPLTLITAKPNHPIAAACPPPFAAPTAHPTRSILTMGALGNIKGRLKHGFKKNKETQRLGCDVPKTVIQEEIDHLNELRSLPIKERFERLNNQTDEERCALLASGTTGNAVVSQLIAEYDWTHFNLDTPGTAGVYPYALLCRLAYQSENCNGREALCFNPAFSKIMDAGYTIASVHDQIIENSPVSNRALIISKDDQAVVVARGTQSIWDLITNINAFSYPRKETLHGYCHRGYYAVTENIWPDIEAHLEALQKKVGKPMKVSVVGHSMGSPIATLISEHIEQKEAFSIAKVVTIGGVKAYNHEACEAYAKAGLDKKTIRIINYADSITLLWPHFQHPGSDNLFFTKKGQYRFNPSITDKLINQLQRFQDDNELHEGEDEGEGEYERKNRSLSDHDLDDYIKILYVHSMDTLGSDD